MASNKKQLSAKQQPSHEALRHSWQNLTAHIVRERTEEEEDEKETESDSNYEDGLRIARCRILGLEVYVDGNVRLFVEFYEKGMLMTKTVTPMALVNTQSMYVNKYAVSDDEEDERDDDNIIQPAQRLPRLTCANPNVLSPVQLRKLQWTLKETNLQIRMMARIPNIDNVFHYTTS